MANRAERRGRASALVERNRGPAARYPSALLDPACYGRGVKQVRLAETHVSWVFLTGRYAYKVKKPVKLPFVDFSTLALRRRFCREELRINRRLAPDLYLAVVPIGGARSAPRVGRTPAFEYAVKMREFPADARLDLKLAANRLPRAARRRVRRAARAIPRRPTARFAVSQRPRSARPRCATSTSSRELRRPRPTASRSRRCALGSSAAARSLATTFAQRVAAGRASRVPRRSAPAEPVVARRRDHGVRRARVRPHAARHRRDQRGRVPGDGPARARPHGSRVRVLEPLSRSHRRLRRARRACSSTSSIARWSAQRSPRSNAAQTVRAARTGTTHERYLATALELAAPRHDRCSSSRTACPAAARPPSPTSSSAACRRCALAPTSSASGCTASDAAARTHSGLSAGFYAAGADTANLRARSRTSRTACCATARPR